MSAISAPISAAMCGGAVLVLLQRTSYGQNSSSPKNQNTLTVEDVLRGAEKDFQDGRLETALAKCRWAIEMDPRSAYAYFLLGLIQHGRGAQAEAKQALEQAVKLDSTRIASRIYLARLHLEDREWQSAENEFQAAIRLGDTTGAGRFGAALAFLGEKRYAEALPHIRAAVDEDPKDPDKLFTLVATEIRLKQLASAKRSIGRLEALAGGDPWILFRLGKLLHEHGMLKEADAELEHAAASFPEGRDNTHAHLSLSEIYLQMARVRFDRRDYSSALASLKKIEAGGLDATSEATALDIEGAALLAMGRIRESAQILRLAAKAKPDDADVALLSVWADVLAGDIEGATGAVGVAREKWPTAPAISRMQAVVSLEHTPERMRVPLSSTWHLKGEGLVCCPCKVPCPCRSNGAPTYKHCENTGVFRITKGHYGNIILDGMTFARTGTTMGPEAEPPNLYVSRLAADDQVIALQRVIQSFNPLRPMTIPNVKRADLSFQSLPGQHIYEVRIPEVFEIKIQRQLDPNGKPMMQTAAVDFFSNTLEYARNVIYKAWDPDGSLRWDYSGRQANYREIDVDSGDYLEGRMLVQFADGSGSFNDKQLELIKNLELPTLREYPKAAK